MKTEQHKLYRSKSAVALALMLAPLASLAHAQNQETGRTMEISRNGERQSIKGPEAWFSGSVRIDPLFDPKEPDRTGSAIVTFEPGARTAWHTHPLGQRLVVTSGLGWTQVEGGQVEELRPGDVVWCPPNVRHWHGATPKTAMTHIAIQESLNGSPVTWLEKVTDDQYRLEPRK